MLETHALWAAFALMVPLMLYTAWYDIKHLRIPNWIPLTVLGIYIVTGLWGLPWEAVLWGLAAGAAALVLFFCVWAVMDMIGIAGIGAGDIKLFAALVPFVAQKDSLSVLTIYAVTTMIFGTLFLIAWGFNRKARRLASLNQKEKRFWKVASPFGVALAATALIYLGRAVQGTLS